MSNFTVDIDRTAFDNKIRTVRILVNDEIKRVVTETADRVVTESKKIVPVDTGRLRDSIHSKVMDEGFTAHVIADTPYAAYVEFGTSRMSAQPYLTPSLELVKPFYIEELKRAIEKLG